MTRTRRTLVLISLLAVACGSASGGNRVGGSTDSPGPGGRVVASSHGRQSGARPQAPVSQSPGATPAHPVAGSAPSADGPSPGLSPFEEPYKASIPVSASVDPTCVLPGTAETLSVQTHPGALVVYQAVYSDGHGGGAPPWGKGYGGNAGGKAGPDGSYTSGWVVSPNAPRGEGRVDVTVAWNGKWGYAHPRFTVADASGSC